MRSQTAIKLAPDFVDAYVRLGEAYLIGTANAKDAVEPLQRALQLQPDLSRARRLLGTAYLRQHRTDEAIHHLKQAQQNSEARYLLGLTYFQAENFTQAIPHFEAVIKRQNLHAKAHFNLGNCYLRTGKIAEGRAALRTFEKLTRERRTINNITTVDPRHPTTPTTPLSTRGTAHQANRMGTRYCRTQSVSCDLTKRRKGI